MQIEFIYAITIVTFLIFLLSSVLTRSYFKMAMKGWFKRFSFNILAILTITTALITSVFAVYFAIDKSFKDSYRKGMLDTTYISKPSPSGSSSDSLQSYTLEQFQKFNDESKLNINSKEGIHFVTGIVKLTSNEGEKYVRLFGIDPSNIRQNVPIEERVPATVTDLSSGLSTLVNLYPDYYYGYLYYFSGPDFNTKDIIVIDAVEARRVLSMPDDTFNSFTTTQDLKEGFYNDFNVVNLDKRFKVIYGGNQEVVFYILAIIIPLILLTYLYIAGLKKYVENSKNSLSKIRAYGVSGDILTIFNIQKLIPEFLISLVIGPIVGLFLGGILFNIIRLLYKYNNNLLVDPSRLRLEYSNYLNAILPSIGIVFIFVFIISYFVFSALLSRSPENILKSRYSFSNSNYVRMFIKLLPLFFIALSFIFLYNAIFASTTSLSQKDDQLFRYILFFIGIETLFLSIKRFIKKRVIVNNFDRYYFIIGFILTLIFVLIPSVRDVLNYWLPSYILIGLFLVIYLALIIRNFKVFSILFVLSFLVFGAFLRLNIDSFSFDNQSRSSNVTFNDPVGKANYEEIFRDKVKSIKKSGSTLIEFTEYKKKDYPKRFQTSDDKQYYTNLILFDSSSIESLNLSLKDKREDIKSSSDLQKILENEKDSIIVGSFFNNSEYKDYAPQIKVGDKVKIRILDSDKVVEKTVIATIEGSDVLQSSVIGFYKSIRNDFNVNIPTTYALDLKSNDFDFARKEVLGRSTIYNDKLNEKDILISSTKAYIEIFLMQNIVCLIILIATYLLRKK